MGPLRRAIYQVMSEANQLVQGTPRVGWLIDGDEDTPHQAVMLEDRGDRVTLSIPLQGFHAGPYGRWFASGVQFGDDPERSKHSYSPPRALMFQDTDGPVVLLGCRADKWRASGVGVGQIVPTWVVFGARHLRYERITGMRSEIPGFSAWIGATSRVVTPTTDADARVQRLEVTLDAPAPTRLAAPLNLTMVPSWRTSHANNRRTFSVHDIVWVETKMRRPIALEDHLSLHGAIRDLVALSAWENFGFATTHVNRDDDPVWLLGEPSPRWCPARSYLLTPHDDWPRCPQFLFTFNDIGIKGIRKWLRLRKHFSAPIGALVALLDSPGAYVESRILQAGAALEHLGYQLAVEQGLNPKSQVNFNSAVNYVLNDIKVDPLSDSAGWKTRVNACYMGTKHPDRPKQDLLTIAQTHAQTLLVLRAWLAGRLGAPAAELEGRLANDRAHKFTIA